MSNIVDSSLKTTVKSSTLVLFGMMISILLWFVAKILVVRSTTKEEFGIYSIAVAVAGMLSVLGSLGVQDGIARFIPIFLGENREEDADSMSGAAIKLSLISGLFSFGVLFLLSDTIARYVFYKPEIEASIKVIAIFVPCSVVANVVGGIFRGHNIMTPKVYILDMGQPFFFLVLVVIFSSLNLPFISIVYAYAAGMAIVCVVAVIYLSKRLRLKPFASRVGRYGRELLEFSAPLLVAMVLAIALSWCDTIMLGRYTNASKVGVYNIAMSLAKLLIFPLGATEFAFMPIAGELYAKKQLGELNKTYQVLTKWNFSATLPIFFVLFFFPETTITFLFGSRFIDASAALRILSICFLFHAFLGTNGVLMIVIGRSKDLFLVSLFGTLLDVVLNYVLIKIYGYGVIGAAFATLVSYFMLNIIISLILYRISGINPLTSAYVKPIFGSLAAGLTIYVLAKNLPLYLWLLPVYFILFVMGYVIALLFTKSVTGEDVALFEAVLRKTGLEMHTLRRVLGRYR